MDIDVNNDNFEGNEHRVKLQDVSKEAVVDGQTLMTDRPAHRHTKLHSQLDK